MKKSIEEAKKDINYAIEQAGGKSASTLLNESYPFITGMTLTVCSKPRETLLGGIVVARVAQSQAELSSLLEGEEPSKLPNFNIDWDTRSDISGTIVAMGSIDFDTVEEGAKKLSEAIEEKVPRGCWRSDEEQDKLRVEANRLFVKWFKAHCEGDCPDQKICQVRWPGGFGLQGCTFPNRVNDPIWKEYWGE